MPTANRIAVRVTDVAYEGNQTHVACETAGSERLLSLLGPRDPDVPAPGAAAWLDFAPLDAILLPPATA